jgi:hypothetical protein
MDKEEKKVFLLLKSIIFQYHGLDEEEQLILQNTADKLQAQEELKWAQNFISQDYLSAFDRVREYLSSISLEKDRKLHYLNLVWKANNEKGYITEMEAIGMLRLAKDWKIEDELISLVRG